MRLVAWCKKWKKSMECHWFDQAGDSSHLSSLWESNFFIFLFVFFILFFQSPRNNEAHALKLRTHLSILRSQKLKYFPWFAYTSMFTSKKTFWKVEYLKACVLIEIFREIQVMMKWYSWFLKWILEGTMQKITAFLVHFLLSVTEAGGSCSTPDRDS